MEKKEFKIPQVEIDLFDGEDIITQSEIDIEGGQGGGSNGDVVDPFA